MKYSLITLVPVLNEAKNIKPLCQKLNQLDLDLGVIFIVTTKSEKEQDPTYKKVKVEAKNNSNIHYISNEKRGLGDSLKQGMNYALDNFKFNQLCTMDADGSHPPKLIEKLVGASEKADLVLGSRYLEKSEVNWNPIRHKGSKIVNFLCRLFTGITVRDHTTGFRIYKKEILESLNFDKIKAKGFVFQAEMLHKIYKQGGAISETPIKFKKRKKGKSKFRTIDKLEYIRVIGPLLPKTIYKKTKRIFKNLTWLAKLGWKVGLIKLFYLLGKERKDPVRIMIKFNNFCNYKCKTCKIWKNENKTVLNKEKQREIIKKYKNNIFFLTITGGEPFLSPKMLSNFIERCAQDCPNLKFISLNTNCSRPKITYNIINKLLQKYPFFKIYLGVHYIPSQNWGEQKTGIKKARQNYLKIIKRANYLKKRYKSRFKAYKILTLSSPKDIEYIKNEKNLWLNFAEVNEFYSNTESESIVTLSKKNKLQAIEKFKEKNKQQLSLLNKKYLKQLEKTIKNNERKRPCYAGINRLYFNEKGDEFICSRGIKARNQMNEKVCKKCWTACEANFDMMQDFFIRF